MHTRPMAFTIKNRLAQAAHMLGTSDPLPYVGGLIDRSFALPEGDQHYANNNLTPGTVAFEPSFSEHEPDTLRFTMEPLGPQSPPLMRRDEATREMRRLIGPRFGYDALRWFDQRSEEWRTMFGSPRLSYGAWFGTSYDHDGLLGSKVYYEISPNQLDALPRQLAHLVQVAMATMPSLLPIFTTISCKREQGHQRVTFVQRGELRLADLNPLLNRLGLAHQLPALMQVMGLCLGGRFDLPEQSVLIALGGSEDDPEFKFYVLLGMLPDLPPSFLDLLRLSLAEHPRELRGLGRWLQAYTPDWDDWPGDFSVLSIHATRHTPVRVSLYLRPAEFDISRMMQADS